MSNAAVNIVFCVGALCMWVLMAGIILLGEAVGEIIKIIKTNRELALLNKKNPNFVTQYIKFKTELNNWKETKKDYKI
jgi:hypothetical protein